MSKCIDCVYLGRLLGIASGWDGESGKYIQFNDFAPAIGVDIPECYCLIFNEESGLYECQDEDGNAIVEGKDIVTLLSSVSRITS